LELSEDEYRELKNRVINILEGGYGLIEKHILAVKLENSTLLNKFLKSIQYDSISERNGDLISKVCDCLEY
jgi:hypothetical protein